MRIKVWVSLVMGLAGVAMLVAAVFAGPAASAPSSASSASKVGKKGGTLNFASSNTDVDYIDPALAYGVLSWGIEYVTQATLLTYPDKSGDQGSQLQPEVAAGLPIVSKDGKTYTFTIKPGFKFNTGQPVTAANFAAAFNRDADPAMNSPVSAFVTDIVGFQAVLDKKAKTVSGVTAKGNKLTIKLTEPDGGLLNKLAMPFFGAIPVNLQHDPNGLNTLPSAGRYYVADRTVGRQLILKRNPNYKGGRPANADTMVFTMNTNPQQTMLQIQNGQYAADPNRIPVTSSNAQFAQQYGINKSRFFVHTLVETDYLALNTTRPGLNSVALRKAINFAIDRPAILRAGGAFRGKRTAQILPAALAGKYYGQHLYPLAGADTNKAKSLAGGKCGDLTLWYSTGTTGTPQSQVVKYNLEQAGCKVSTKPFQGFAIYNAAGVKGADYDLALVGWNQDYPDGYDFFHILLDGRTIHDANNNDLAYVNDATLNKGIDAANRLTGEARKNAWGKLDVLTMSKIVPWAPIDNRNQIDFIAPNITGYVFQPAYAIMDFGTLALK